MMLDPDPYYYDKKSELEDEVGRECIKYVGAGLGVCGTAVVSYAYALGNSARHWQRAKDAASLARNVCQPYLEAAIKENNVSRIELAHKCIRNNSREQAKEYAAAGGYFLLATLPVIVSLLLMRKFGKRIESLQEVIENLSFR